MNTLPQAIADGEHGMSISFAKAERNDPYFAVTAKQAILAHLKCGPCDGETLTDIAKAHGAWCRDGRSFGAVFKALAADKLIVCLRSDLPRRNGHGSSGGKLWELA